MAQTSTTSFLSSKNTGLVLRCDTANRKVRMNSRTWTFLRKILFSGFSHVIRTRDNSCLSGRSSHEANWKAASPSSPGGLSKVSLQFVDKRQSRSSLKRSFFLANVLLFAVQGILQICSRSARTKEYRSSPKIRSTLR